MCSPFDAEKAISGMDSRMLNDSYCVSGSAPDLLCPEICSVGRVLWARSRSVAMAETIEC